MAESLTDDIEQKKSSGDLKECEDFQEWLRCHEFDAPGLFTLRNAFTKIVKYYFSDRRHIMVWEDDLACDLDNLDIRPGAVIDPGNTEHVPGIVISTGDGINYETPWIKAQVDKIPDYATMQNVHVAKTNLTFVCTHYDADTVAKMSDALFACLVSIEPMLFATWSWLMLYRPLQQTSPQLARKAQEPEAFETFYESRVVIEFTYEYGTVTRIESRRMQDYVLHGPLNSHRSVDVGPKVR